MALRQISTSSNMGEPVKLAKIPVGSTVSGYIQSIVPSSKPGFGPSLLMVSEDLSTTFYCSPAGNVNYKIKDNALVVGQFTLFTRNKDVLMKKSGKTRSDFTIQQDDERTLDAAQLAAKKVSTTANTSSDKKSIRDQAAAIASAVAAGGAKN